MISQSATVFKLDFASDNVWTFKGLENVVDRGSREGLWRVAWVGDGGELGVGVLRAACAKERNLKPTPLE
jgi:hypothetical protein